MRGEIGKEEAKKFCYQVKSTKYVLKPGEQVSSPIRQWLPADEAMEDCDIDLWDMYRDYINGTREIAEINASFFVE